MTSFHVELDRAAGVSQSEEALTVTFEDGRREHMRLHEYGRVYAVPGLYEEVVQSQLECASPATLASALVEQVTRLGEDAGELRVFDLGAGNGVFGEELRTRGVTAPLVGLDDVPEARTAAHRDRPGLYGEYLVGGLEDVSVESLVAEHRLNCLVAAGALGEGHVSVATFDGTWNAFPAGSWLAVTFSEGLLDAEVEAEDTDEMAEYVQALRRGEHDTEVLHLSRFRHRLRMSGEPIFYCVLVARRSS